MDFAIDPSTQDYSVTNGLPDRSVSGGLMTAAYLRLMTPLGQYWADTTLGSRLHELQREKDLSRVAILAQQYAEIALAPLLNDGRATLIEVSSERPQQGWLSLLIRIVSAGGDVISFHHPVKVI